MANQRILATEEMVGYGHSTKADTLNRFVMVEHNEDGTHTTQHGRSHVITAALDHTSTATAGQMLKADANGLPVDATNTDTQVAAAVTASHSNSADHTQNTDTGTTSATFTIETGSGTPVVVTGGSNTFNVANGTASLDVAAGAAVNIDDDVTVAAELHVEAATHVNQDLTTDASPTFVTAKLSGLTDDYIPYHVNDSTGLANGPTKTAVDALVTAGPCDVDANLSAAAQAAITASHAAVTVSEPLVLSTQALSFRGVAKYLSSYADLATAISTIGATQCQLIIDASVTADDATFPSTLSVEIQKGAIITVPTTKTLTINGPFSSGLYQVFDCTGTPAGVVVFGAGSVKEIYPQWWGGSDTQQIQAAIVAACTLTIPGTVYISEGTWQVGAGDGGTMPLMITAGIRIYGAGDTSYIRSVDLTNHIFHIACDAAVTMTDMQIAYGGDVSPDTGKCCIYVTDADGDDENNGSHFERLYLRNGYINIHFYRAAWWVFSSCTTTASHYASIKVQNVNDSDEGDSTICNNVIGGRTGSTADILYYSSGGLRISNNKILSPASYGIALDMYGILTSDTGLLIITGNSIENHTVTEIFLTNSATVTFDGDPTHLTFVDGGGSADTLTDSDNGFVTDGFTAGMYITISGATTSANDGIYPIVTAAAGTLTFATGSWNTGEVGAALMTVVREHDFNSVVIDGNTIVAPTSHAIVQTVDSWLTRLVISNNVIATAGAYNGINLSGATGGIIEGNFLSGSTGTGITLSSSVSNFIVGQNHFGTWTTNVTNSSTTSWGSDIVGTFTATRNAFTEVHNNGAITSTGKYVRIGKLVTVFCMITATVDDTIAAVAGTSYISGLPAALRPPSGIISSGSWTTISGGSGGHAMINSDGNIFIATAWSAGTGTWAITISYYV
uniref:Putative pectate lyase n=1 Tax=viral metagenome TaxID=1070528 RepID=A0A6H1Z7M4_9ZZZZ